MPRIDAADLGRMRDQLLFDGPDRSTRLTRFWALLVLSAIIASAGVVGDSTATVIGAMIVAPLMTPILAAVLSMITADGANLARSLTLIITGAACVVVIGYLVGLLVSVDVVAASSSQVAGRVQPRLIDLVAALATGAVGSFALVRSDVSDTLPGVAIAISLVPPLAVVGVTLEAGAGDEAAGALLLFLTNVGAILLSGLVVMALYRVGRGGGKLGGVTTPAAIAVVAFVLVLAVPLAASSAKLTRDAMRVRDVTRVAQAWAEPAGWRIDVVDTTNDGVVVRAAGAAPAPDAEALRRDLDEAGLDDVSVRLVLTPEATIELDAR